MIPLIASALYGLAGYQNNENRKRDDARQAKIDERAEEEFARKKEAWATEDAIKTGMRDATAPVAVETPNDVLKDDDGNDMPAVPAFRAGTQRFATMAEAQTAAEKANTPEAVMARQVQVLNKNGKPLEAINMGNAVMDAKLKKLGLSSAEAKFADDEFNRKLIADIDSNPNWTVGAAKVLTDTQVGSLKGVTVTARPSQDGKTVDFVGVGADGAEKVLKTFNNGPEGRLEFLQTAQKASLETKLSHLVERVRSEKDAAKTAKEDSRWQQEFDLKKKDGEDNKAYRERMLGFQAAQDQRAAQTHKLAMEDAKVPAATKQMAGSYQKQIELVSAALNKAMAEGSFNPENKGTKDLLAEQAVLREEYKKLLAPHMPSIAKNNAPPADPYGFDKTAPGAAAPAGPQAVPAVSAPAAAPVAPVRPVGADPNVQAQQATEQAQMFYRNAVARMAEFNKDPEVQTLRQSHSDALRAGRAMQANNIMAQIKQIQTQRYGAQ